MHSPCPVPGGHPTCPLPKPQLRALPEALPALPVSPSESLLCVLGTCSARGVVAVGMLGL